MTGAGENLRPAEDGQLQSTPAASLGKYQVFASLGRGGMADVFLAVARGPMGFNKLAVIKRLRQGLADDASFRRMFLDEARLAARLNHPNIVHTYEVGDEQGSYFIAMEYLEGQALNKLQKALIRRREMLEPELAVRMVADALAGLGFAHELRDYDGSPLQIIHRDVSPHNIFVTYDGHTKVVDFGIAKAALSSTETEVGILKGKVAYMSPEQAIGLRIDARSDLFAMGIVLWELLTQQKLMRGDNAAATLHRLVNEPIPRVSHVRPDVDPELDALVARALEKDAPRRFSSAAEMRDALERYLSSSRRAATRQEDVARKMQLLFGSVRAEVQRQVNDHMALFKSAQTTQELGAIAEDSLRRREGGGAVSSSAALPHLGGSGSGSGVVAGYAAASYAPSVPPTMTVASAVLPPMASPMPPTGPQPTSTTNALSLVVVVGLFVLAAVAIVVVGLRGRGRADDVMMRARETQAATVASAAATVSPPIAMVVEPKNIAAPVVASATPAQPATSVVPSASSTHRPMGASHAVAALPQVPSAKVPSAVVPPPAASEDPGFLTINSYPWAKVSEGSRSLCTTPCPKVALSPGTHQLVLENVEQGLKQSISVVIRSGEVTTKQVGLK